MNTITPIELATLAVLIAHGQDSRPEAIHVAEAIKYVERCSDAIAQWRGTQPHPDPRVHEQHERLNDMMNCPAGTIIYEAAADEIDRLNKKVHDLGTELAAAKRQTVFEKTE